MANYRKLGRTSDQRQAMLRALTTSVLEHGHIFTTEARAKEVRKQVEHLIALGVREKDNYEEVTVKAKVARKDANGKRVKEEKEIDGKKVRVTVFDEVDKTIRKDKPSRLAVRRQILAQTYVPVSVPKAAAGRKKNTKKVDIPAKLFNEYGPKYADRKGGYTRIVKVGPRKGDGAMVVLLELV